MKVGFWASIRKHLVLIVLMAVLPALAIILYCGLDQRQQAIESAEREITLLARNIREAHMGQLEAVRQTLATLAQVPAVQNLDPQASSDFFRLVAARVPGIFNLTASTVDGEVFASGRTFAATSLADRKHFREALSHEDFAAGEYLLTRIGGETPTFPYAYPVLDPAGVPRAVLTLTLKLEHLARLYETVPLPEGSFIAITDHRGVRLSYYPARDETNPVGRPIAPEAWALAEKNPEQGFGRVRASDGRTRLVAYQAVRLAPGEAPYMYMWAGVPEDHILEGADRILLHNLLLMAGSIVAALVFSWWLGKKTIVEPVRMLVAVTEDFAQGDFQARGNLPDADGELGMLARSFGRMAESLEKSRESLRSSEERYRTLFECSADGLLIADMTTRRFKYANPMICSMLGYTEEELLGMGVEDIHPQMALAEAISEFEKIVGKNLLHSRNVPCRRKDGSIFFADINATILDLDGTPCRLGMFRDVSERKLDEERLRHLAMHDELTGLANRTLLQDRLENAIHYAQRSDRFVGVLMLDLDRFKEINDSFGHDFGDKLLCAVAQRLVNTVREADTVARLGGDEFVILLAELPDAERVAKIADKILRHLAEPLWIDGRDIQLTASLGGSLYPRDGFDGETLIRYADMAMYQAKKSGRNRFALYDAAMGLNGEAGEEG
ncbi:diguanylate cyclase domain-containing protein [Desulfuromonas acetexigens]|uniref:Diguanylate cyclase n=1 Tax=Trichloromonas acetexigens TaxID=38815 RepID=A0A550JBE5_9BACT|nr:diguanylate cyclase [Desulfuromonas acetexigens]TRO80579.1 diguanylate cyclase [Desulfuromonas acetexigens]